MADTTLIIGNKAYSSWSLRPWLALKAAEVPFSEVVIPLSRPDTRENILKHSPSGRVPVLQVGTLTIWDSLAICEWAAEAAPAAGLWPADRHARAVARSVVAEMHSGFAALRQHLPMDLKCRHPGRALPADVRADIDRVLDIWRSCRTRFGADGPFLFGRFGLADAFYAPVVTRFETYGVELDTACRAYSDAVLDLPAMREWRSAAEAEPWELGAP